MVVDSKFRASSIVAALVLMHSCTDGTAPTVSEVASAYAVDMPVGTLKHEAGAPVLESYSTQLWLVQGRANNLLVRYASGGATASSSAGAEMCDPSRHDGSSWFLKIAIPPSVQLVAPDGESLAKGDSILVTVDVDSTRLAASFAPHGLQFAGKKQAKLVFKYACAELAGQDPENLKLYYQPRAEMAWVEQATEVNTTGRKVWMFLSHFSNYAVSF